MNYFNTSGADIAAGDSVIVDPTASAVAGLGGEIIVGPAFANAPVIGAAKAVILDGDQGEVVVYGILDLVNVDAGVGVGAALVQSGVAGQLMVAAAPTDFRVGVAMTAAVANQATVYFGH